MPTYYHVTYLRNLDSIMDEGLRPSRGGSNFGTAAYAAHSVGSTFLCDAHSVRFWHSRLSDHAEHNHDDPLEAGEIAVVLRVKGDVEVRPDELGSMDGPGESFMTSEHIKPRDLEVFDGSRFVKLSSIDPDEMQDQAEEAASYEEDYVIADMDVFLPRSPKLSESALDTFNARLSESLQAQEDLEVIRSRFDGDFDILT